MSLLICSMIVREMGMLKVKAEYDAKGSYKKRACDLALSVPKIGWLSTICRSTFLSLTERKGPCNGESGTENIRLHVETPWKPKRDASVCPEIHCRPQWTAPLDKVALLWTGSLLLFFFAKVSSSATDLIPIEDSWMARDSYLNTA